VAAVFAVGTVACCTSKSNPPIKTALAAHGNTDWHVDTANEFLFGTDMSGAVTAANHCPNDWTKTHIHVGLSNVADFYGDESRVAAGADKNATSGIDRTTLFFYAGHGNPTLWNTLGDNASQTHCFLGDCVSGIAGLRYYWQCSCEVFAHGPRVCAGGGGDYACPGDFDGSADSYNMRNVYERWGPALYHKLRMACGASTLAYCHESQANAIWNNYNNLGKGVADSFIDGMSIYGGVVPLCITLGGSDVTKTPLYDAVFTNQPNTSGTSYYHVQYLDSYAKKWRPIEIVWHELPIFVVKPGPLPDWVRKLKLEPSGEELVGAEPSGLDGFGVRVRPISGAIIVEGEKKLPAPGPGLKREQALERAVRFLEQRQLAEAVAAEPEVERMMLQSRPAAREAKPGPAIEKSTEVRFRRMVDVDGSRVPVLGAGGVIEVTLNPDASVARVVKVWRSLAGVKRVAPVKSLEEASAEASKKLGETKEYKLDRWDFGYAEADANSNQGEMRVYYHFLFVPRDPEALLTYPPRMIWIAAQAD
jgi:hypothetical protein